MIHLSVCASVTAAITLKVAVLYDQSRRAIKVEGYGKATYYDNECRSVVLVTNNSNWVARRIPEVVRSCGGEVFGMTRCQT